MANVETVLEYELDSDATAADPAIVPDAASGSSGVLILEKGHDTALELQGTIAGEGFRTRTVETVGEARACIAEARPDLILINTDVEKEDCAALIREASGQGITVVAMVPAKNQADAHQALLNGASSYLARPIERSRLVNVLRRFQNQAPATDERISIRRVSRPLEGLGELLGNSPEMQEVYAQIERVAPTSASILITGESGTGKEVAAQTIHNLSRRRDQPFVPVNCGAISPQLIESELFGHEKGSFTGAVREHRGYFERASGGTLFLDEITEMPIELQVKLLRVLETRRFARVGSNYEIETDVRIIAATNRCTQEALDDGHLRADLLYRIQVFPIWLPPVRERGQDIELLAVHFLKQFNAAEGMEKRFSESALARLCQYHWPGNLRELKNVVYRAFIMANDVIGCADLPTESASPAPGGTSFTVRVGSSVAEVERNLIMATLDQCDGKKEKAAGILGVSIKTLYNKLKEYEAAGTRAVDGKHHDEGSIGGR